MGWGGLRRVRSARRVAASPDPGSRAFLRTLLTLLTLSGSTCLTLLALVGPAAPSAAAQSASAQPAVGVQTSTPRSSPAAPDEATPAGATPATAAPITRGSTAGVLPRSGTGFYRIDVGRGERLHASAVADVPMDSLALDVVDPAGRPCAGLASRGFGGSAGTVLPATATVHTPVVDASSGPCLSPDAPVLLRVVAAGSGPASEAPRVDLAVAVDPPVDEDALPAPQLPVSSPLPLDAPSAGPSAVQGSATPGGAPSVADAVVSDRLTAGEVRYYRVDLTYGNRLDLQVRALGGGLPSDRRILVWVLNPVRQQVRLVAQGIAPDPRSVAMPLDSHYPALTTGTPGPVRYREGDRVGGLQPLSLEGSYYVALSLEAPPGATQPVVLATQVRGQEEPPHEGGQSSALLIAVGVLGVAAALALVFYRPRPAATRRR